MRQRTIPLLAAAAALAAAASIPFFAGNLAEASPPLAEPDPSKAEPTPSTAYRLREYQGKLAVFRAGESDPQQIIDLDIRLLPPYDQGQLRSGIPAQGEEELARLLEDYTS